MLFSVKQVRVDLSEVDPPKKPRLEKQENRSSPITVQTSKDLLPNISDYDETNADDFAMEMGLACVVCRYILILLFFMADIIILNLMSGYFEDRCQDITASSSHFNLLCF